MIPYRPSNGSEGDGFYAAWCARCHREQGGRQCRIFSRTLALGLSDPGYPKEWIAEADGSDPRCTAFEEPHRVTRHRTIRDRRQPGLL